jgi:heterodisulfide reductase subunit A-like polyferredoxin
MEALPVDNQPHTPSAASGAACPRVGVYVCHCGGNISDVVDVERVVQAAARLPGVAVARHFSAMCSQGGQNLLVDDIRQEKLERVVVAACSPSLHEHTFRAAVARAELNPYLYEPVSLREQVSWCTASDPEAATDKAIRLVAAGIAKARKLEPLAAISMKALRHVTVVGGGVTGLRAARDLSRLGLAVTLLERSPFLGGRMTQWHQVYPLAHETIELDPFRARVDPDRCHGHGKCVEACAHQQAIELVPSERNGRTVNVAHVNAALCNGCGICVSVCPIGAIQVAGWRLDQFEAMVDALVADEV